MNSTGTKYSFSTMNSGAFTGMTSVNTIAYTAISGNRTTTVSVGAKLDLSTYNSIYTDSGKVYPLSLALNFIIKT